MKLLQGKSLLVSNCWFEVHNLLFSCILLFSFTSKAQISNYISNGGFEVLISNTITSEGFDKVKYWGPIDTTKGAYYFFTATPGIGTVPYCSTGFQLPRNGNNFILSQFFCDTCVPPRAYPRNRLKHLLKPNTIYCAKYHVVNTNNNRVAIENYGMFFGDSNIDTIQKCNDPITYLFPQVEYQNGIITDTLNWIPVQGTFVALGTEKYCVLGNFRSNAATNTLLIQPALPFNSNDVYIDDVSLIEMDLPAYAGPDKNVIVGDSLYIGRESDVEIDESCIWYQMTSPTTSITVDTIAGIWVKPVTTTTYVVRQQLWCSGVKWDTVVVSMDAVGISETGVYQNDIKIFPNPASNFIEVEYSFDKTNPFNEILFYNQLGELVLRDSPAIKNKKATISVSKLVPGVYSIEFKEVSGHIVRKRLIVSK